MISPESWLERVTRILEDFQDDLQQEGNDVSYLSFSNCRFLENRFFNPSTFQEISFSFENTIHVYIFQVDNRFFDEALTDEERSEYLWSVEKSSPLIAVGVEE